jgi:S-DNA-T family DNA segregation ATPase FtsK/SpoIIIE
MTFPLGSLRADGADVTPDRRESPTSTPGWRVQAALLVGAVVWLLAVLALSTHHTGDPGFSTSGDASPIRNGAGLFGAWFSDLAFFLAGYSVWWAVLVGARAWLGALARSLRAAGGATVESVEPALPAWTMGLGLALLLAASSSLEWTRLYQWESQVAGGNAGGILGLVLGRSSQSLLGFAGSGVLWIAALVGGASLAFRFSWLRVADALGAAIENLRTRRVERI